MIVDEISVAIHSIRSWSNPWNLANIIVFATLGLFTRFVIL